MSVRTTEIRPPSIRAETVGVLKAALAVVLLSAAYVLRPSLPVSSDGAVSPGLLPYQRLVGEATVGEQRIFRELQEGLLEAERIRTTSGQWPDVQALAALGVPPFAADPTQKTQYTWSSVRQDWVVNYLGIPSDPMSPAWVLVVLEPEPGAPPDPAPTDETHHRLIDGTTLHVSVWAIPEQKRGSGFAALRLPQNEGWTQLLVGNYAESRK
jgi:hypothetical protein